MMEELIDDWKDKFFPNERMLELEQFAKEFHLEFKKRDRFASQRTGIKGFRIFKGSKGKRLKGIIHKEDSALSCKARIYDYLYFGEVGKKNTTIIEIETPQLNLSRFIIRPKGNLEKLKEIFISREKLFPEMEEFHARYELKAKDAELTEYELNDRILDLVMTKRGIRVEGGGKYLLVYYKNKLIPAGNILKEYGFALEMVDSLINDHSDELV